AALDGGEVAWPLNRRVVAGAHDVDAGGPRQTATTRAWCERCCWIRRRKAMQGLLLVRRGCLFAGCTPYSMCTDYEAHKKLSEITGPAPTTEQAGFYQQFRGLSRRLFIVMFPNLGNAALIQQTRFWPFSLLLLLIFLLLI